MRWPTLLTVAVLAALLASAPSAADANGFFGFADTGDHFAHEDIHALGAAYVTEGTACGTQGDQQLFCPGEPLQRWVMAVWLVRILDDGAEPPSVDVSRFNDIDASQWWAAYVERFAQLGITLGYPDGTYRPSRSVTRAQMAAFLTRAFDLPQAADAGFTDTEGNTHRDAINRLAAAGVTRGCGDGSRYCPSRDTKRGEMAAFINRAQDPDTTTQETTPRPSALGQLYPGGNHTCSVTWGEGEPEGPAVCWGDNEHGQTDAPDAVFKAIDAGGHHTCAIGKIDSDHPWHDPGPVICWGNNEHGQTDAPDGTYSLLTAGGAHTCATRGLDHTCWGNNEHGQIDVPEGEYRSVSAGGAHTCAIGVIDSDPSWNLPGPVVCWGNNEHGQIDVPEGEYRSVSAGGAHTCAIGVIDSDPSWAFWGPVVCWGNNDYGQTDAPDGTYDAVAAGGAHTCATSGDTITCWGNNDHGQADAPGLRGQTPAVTAGAGHTCAGALYGQRVTCWGNNDHGQTDVPDGSYTWGWGRFDPCEGCG